MAKFILENSFDNNKDVADFGTSIPAAFFLSLETARVLGNIQTKDINYLAWFKFIIKNNFYKFIDYNYHVKKIVENKSEKREILSHGA